MLEEISIIFGLAVGVLLLFNYLKIPTIIGFLITGVLAGPGALNLIKSTGDIGVFAEIGVILLLFSIGIEFSLKDLVKIKRSIFLGGSLQVVLTTAIFGFIASLFGLPNNECVFLGFLFSLSSTAIVLKIFQERRMVMSPQGRGSLAILIYQDIIVVPMMLIAPFLANDAPALDMSFLFVIFKSIITVATVLIMARYIMPRILFVIARSRSRELFIISVILICMSVAWLTSRLGLSLSLGAFLAGLIISESEYSHEAFSNILPFREVFTSFFFISIGLLLDIGFVFSFPVLVIGVTLITLLLKAFSGTFATWATGKTFRIALISGLALSQVGEFSFILLKTGMDFSLVSPEVYQVFLSVSILTMACTPFLITYSENIASQIQRIPISKRILNKIPSLSNNLNESEPQYKEHKDHLVIIGFGENGKYLSKAAKMANIPYVIMEMDPEIMLLAKASGEPIFYGDAQNETVLEHAGIKSARIIVIATSDFHSTRKIILAVRKINPLIQIIVRTKYVTDIEPLHVVGADEIVTEEFETSIEIFTRVLVKYLVPKDEIKKFILGVRKGGYEMLRTAPKRRAGLDDLTMNISDMEIISMKVNPESVIPGKSLSELHFRKDFGVSVLWVKREDSSFSNPGGHTVLLSDDIIVLFGAPDDLEKIAELNRQLVEV